MANTIRIKRSTGSSAPTSLENAELAFSEGNEILYFGKGTGGAGGSATSIIPVGGKGKYYKMWVYSEMPKLQKKVNVCPKCKGKKVHITEM